MRKPHLPSAILHRIVPTSCGTPALLKKAMNKDVFHNQLALTLGYERIVNDQCINIRIDDSVNPDNPQVMINASDNKLKIVYNASLNSEDIWNTVILPKQIELIETRAIGKKLNSIFDATHQAYIKAKTNPF